MKILLNYIFCFIISILFFLLVFVCILKYTYFNKNYLYRKLEENNYYYNVYQEINEEMKEYITSSGFNDEIISHLFDVNEVRSDINSFLNNMFIGKKTRLSKNNIRYQLDENIRKVLERKNLEIIEENNIKLFINDIVNIYQREITLYNMLDNLIDSFNTINKLINLVLLILIICIFFLAFLTGFIKNNYLSSSIISSGFFVLFIRIFIYERMDIGHLLVITSNFSQILNDIMDNIGRGMYFLGFQLVLVGFLLIAKKVLNNVKRKDKEKYVLKLS